jgi:hypothetical protein
MNKFFVSVGLAAVGTASLHAAYTPETTGNANARAWSVSATLRGFYDDNINTASDGPAKKDSLGFEVTPTIDIAVPLQQTELGLHYVYGLYYYQERQDLGQNPIDQSHQLDLWLDHAFTERWSLKAQDSFRVGQEPELIDPSTSVPTRTEGNNFANTGTMTLSTDWTRLLSTELGFQDNYYHYQNSGGTGAQPSLAGILDRVENSGWLDLQWHALPQTLIFIGYRFTQVNYTGNEPISPLYKSDVRDNRLHYGYLGFQHNFLPNLSVSARGGIQYSDNYNDPYNTTSLGPYADLSATYTYLPGSYLQIGFTRQQNATDIVAPDASGRITQSQESSTVYASINHKLNQRLVASVLGRVQYSTYNSGLYADQSDTFYSAGLNLSYSISDHFSADIGYNFDYLNSGIAGRDYTRNRIYLGVTATY